MNIPRTTCGAGLAIPCFAVPAPTPAGSHGAKPVVLAAKETRDLRKLYIRRIADSILESVSRGQQFTALRGRICPDASLHSTATQKERDIATRLIFWTWFRVARQKGN